MWVADTDRAEVQCFGFSPDGATLYTGDDEGAVFAWDRATQVGRELFRAARSHYGTVPVWQIVPSACGTRLFVPAGNRVHVLDPSGAKKPEKRKAELSNHGARLSLSADGQDFLAPTTFNVAARWDAGTGKRLPLPGALGKYNSCLSVMYLPGGASVLTLSSRGTSLILWDATTGARLGRSVAEDAGSFPYALSPDGTRFAVVGLSRTSIASRAVWTFDLQQRERLTTIELGHIPKGVAFDASGRLLATADGTRSVRTWNAETGEPIGTFHPKVGDVGCVAYSQDGTIWCASGVGRFAVFDVDG